MDREQGRSLFRQAAQQVTATTREAINWTRLQKGMEQMRPNEDAQIYQQLYTSFEGVLGNDYYKYYAPKGHQKTIDLDDFALKVTVTHRALNLEDIYGTDVVYSIAGWKALAFQHKKRDKQGKLAITSKDRVQRAKIMQLCNHCSKSAKMANEGALIKPACGSVYVVGDDRSNARHAVSACQLERYRKTSGQNAKGTSSQFPLIPDLDLVDRMFLACMIGTSLGTTQNKTIIGLMEDVMLARPDIVIRAELESITPPVEFEKDLHFKFN